MALYSVTQGSVQAAGDVQQYFNLLTGVMTDQQVTVSNRIRAQSTGATAASGTSGATPARRCRGRSPSGTSCTTG